MRKMNTWNDDNKRLEIFVKNGKNIFCYTLVVQILQEKHIIQDIKENITLLYHKNYTQKYIIQDN